jgi:hypothetical protein
MNSNAQNPMTNGSAAISALQADDVEATLRLIARLPAPAGLEDRVEAALRSRPRTASVLSWPIAVEPGSNWMRAAAAAAIVFVVAGGGWGIYSHVQQPQAARVIVMPQHLAAPGGFSSAGAMRTPQTLNGPVLAKPVAAPPLQAVQAVQAKPSRKAPAPVRPVQPAAASKVTAQPAK